VTTLGASAANAEGPHLAVDYQVGKHDPAARHLAAISVELLVIFFAAFVLLYGGAELAFKTLQSDQLSPALGVPMGYVYLAAPVSGVLFVLFSLENLARLWSEAPWNRKS
jgi:TRAP-type C4-dicarboxylate transport system permease small subunit